MGPSALCRRAIRRAGLFVTLGTSEAAGPLREGVGGIIHHLSDMRPLPIHPASTLSLSPHSLSLPLSSSSSPFASSLSSRPGQRAGAAGPDEGEADRVAISVLPAAPFPPPGLAGPVSSADAALVCSADAACPPPSPTVKKAEGRKGTWRLDKTTCCAPRCMYHVCVYCIRGQGPRPGPGLSGGDWNAQPSSSALCLMTYHLVYGTTCGHDPPPWPGPGDAMLPAPRTTAIGGDPWLPPPSPERRLDLDLDRISLVVVTGRRRRGPRLALSISSLVGGGWWPFPCPPFLSVVGPGAEGGPLSGRRFVTRRCHRRAVEEHGVQRRFTSPAAGMEPVVETTT
ncbi:hypothetical protein CDD83_720 [Cordyceps sp. RAO-2017]|nr:hypothetical protein CDD83_720 [Cordyceps sp. RAO-2017]